MESPVYKSLEISQAFAALSKNEQLYAYHMSRAAWLGMRIGMRQVSSEANDIFDLLIEIFQTSKGNLLSLFPDKRLSDDTDSEIESFIEYAAMFLNNMGNYYGYGDQKFVPNVSREFMETITATSPKAKILATKCLDAMLSTRIQTLGFPGPTTQSAYYPEPITTEEIKLISDLMTEKGIMAENTRILRVSDGSFHVLQASIEKDNEPIVIGTVSDLGVEVKLARGDHSEELKRINSELALATKYSRDKIQCQMLEKLQESFRTGDIQSYKDSLKLWVQDIGPNVETMFGFVESLRDPYGTRAEFECFVGIQDLEASKVFKKLVERSQDFISTLPWAEGAATGNGPFEKNLFSAPQYKAVNALTWMTSYVWTGKNLPNFEDIRQTVGFKNVFMANKNQTLPASESEAPFVCENERSAFTLHRQAGENQRVAIHELFGHGTGELLNEGWGNIDTKNPPISPLTGQPIKTWYKPSETYLSVFGDLASSIEECRADCVGIWLGCNKALLSIFGYGESSEITSDDLIYNMYLVTGVLGLEALPRYNVDNKTWGQAHSRGHFAMLRTMLDAEGFMTLNINHDENFVTISMDRSKIISHGRRAIGELLLKLHIYRCTADVEAARECYESLTSLDEQWLKVREIVSADKPKKVVFVQPGLFLEDGKVRVKQYERSAKGMLESWLERCKEMKI